MGMTVNVAPRRPLLDPFNELPAKRLLVTMMNTLEASTVLDSIPEKALTLNGSADTPPLSTIYSTGGGLPYMAFNGTDQYLSIADAGWTQPLLATTVIAVIQPTANADEDVCGIWLTTTDKSWKLALTSAGALAVHSTADGTTLKTDTEASAITAGSWHMVAMRYVPGTSLTAWSALAGAAGSYTENTTTINAGQKNTAGVLAIGAADAALTAPYTGNISFVAVVGAALAYDHLDRLWAHMQQYI